MSVRVAAGLQEFQVPFGILSNTTANIASGATLTFNNALNLNGQTLTKSGAGTMTVNNVLTIGGGTVIHSQGTLFGFGTLGGDVINDGTLSPGGIADSNSMVPESATMFVALVSLAGLLGLLRRSRD